MRNHTWIFCDKIKVYIPNCSIPTEPPCSLTKRLSPCIYLTNRLLETVNGLSVLKKKEHNDSQNNNKKNRKTPWHYCTQNLTERNGSIESTTLAESKESRLSVFVYMKDWKRQKDEAKEREKRERVRNWVKSNNKTSSNNFLCSLILPASVYMLFFGLTKFYDVIKWMFRHVFRCSLKSFQDTYTHSHMTVSGGGRNFISDR